MCDIAALVLSISLALILRLRAAPNTITMFFERPAMFFEQSYYVLRTFHRIYLPSVELMMFSEPFNGFISLWSNSDVLRTFLRTSLSRLGV